MLDLIKVRIPHYDIALNVRQSHSLVRSGNRTLSGMDSMQILAALQRLRIPHEEIASAISKDRTVATKMFNGKPPRQIKADEVPKLLALIERYEVDAGETADRASPNRSTVEVEVLPTYAGMGGGGSGDGDRQVAIIDRGLVEDELRAQAKDLLIINVRGDSMEPVFLHGDQIIIDRRDSSPTQPGPFALWFDDGFVLKNVERIRQTGRLRIFSNNPKYTPDEADPEEVQIMGRPVWFSRQL